MQQTFRMRTTTALTVIIIFIAALAAMAWGIFSQTFFSGGVRIGNFGWFAYAFSSGLFLLWSPALLSFTLAIIPLAEKRRVGKAVTTTFAFAFGSLLTLTALGFFSGLVGYIGYDVFTFPLQSMMNWGVLTLGAAAYVLALSEVDLLHVVRLHTGEKLAAMLTRGDGFIGAFMLGIFLSSTNIHPATIVLLGNALLAGDPLHGSALLLMHGIGRIVPVLIVVSMALLGLNVSHWLSERKERGRVLLGWLLIVLGGTLLNTGLYALLLWMGAGSNIMSMFTSHAVLAVLWLAPLWIIYFLESRRVYGRPVYELKNIERALDRTEQERRALEHTMHIEHNENGAHIAKIEQQIDALERQRRIMESGLRHDIEQGLRSKTSQRLEERLLGMRFAFTIATSLLVVSALSVLAY